MTVLLDTNVLVYSHVLQEPEKRRTAVAVTRMLATSGRAVLSVQTIAEFANVALRKLRIPPGAVLRQVEAYLATFRVLPLTELAAREALRGVEAHGFNYYDAQIWAVAKLSGVRTVLSEDFQAGTTIEGVSFANPFLAGFEVSDYL